MRGWLAVLFGLACAVTAGGCCVNPFINTDRSAPGAPGTPEAEVGESLAEAEPAHQATESGEGAKNFGSGGGTRENSNFVGAMMDSVKPLLVAFNGSAAGVGLPMTWPQLLVLAQVVGAAGVGHKYKISRLRFDASDEDDARAARHVWRHGVIGTRSGTRDSACCRSRSMESWVRWDSSH